MRKLIREDRHPGAGVGRHITSDKSSGRQTLLGSERMSDLPNGLLVEAPTFRLSRGENMVSRTTFSRRDVREIASLRSATLRALRLPTPFGVGHLSENRYLI